MPNSVELDALNLTNKFKNVELDFSFPIYYILTILDCKLLSFALSRFIRVWCQKARRFLTFYIKVPIFIITYPTLAFFPSYIIIRHINSLVKSVRHFLFVVVSNSTSTFLQDYKSRRQISICEKHCDFFII